MEMDRQTILVIVGAIIGLTLFGGVYLSSPQSSDHTRPAYTQEDIRYKFQKEDANKPKTKKPKTAVQPTISSSESSGGGEISTDDGENEEPSLGDDSQEEPPLE
jgi:hypothetical protein